MAAGQLSRVRLLLIDNVNVAMLNDLIDGLRNENPPVLNGRESNQIREGCQVTEDKTGMLVDMVYKKGNVASQSLFRILKEKYSHIYDLLGLAKQGYEDMEVNDYNYR